MTAAWRSACCTSFLGVATVGMVLLLGRWWGLGRRGAAMAALLVACDPILLAHSTQVMTETLATFLTTAGLAALTWAGRRTNSRESTTPGMCEDRGSLSGSRWLPAVVAYVLAGAVLALGVLCRPVLLLWAFAVGAVLLWQAFRGIDNSRRLTAAGRIAKSLRSPAAFALGAIVVLSPWAIRNQLQFGRPIVTTTHGGYTLLLANNPEFYGWLRSGSWGSVWEADQFNADWERRCPADELQADRQAYDEAWRTIRGEPGTFFYACLVRIGRFWSPLPHQLSPDETPLRRLSRYAVALWYVVEFLLVAIAVWRSVSRRVLAA